MIEVEGRILPGLDEFMLRTGHLATLCRIALDVGGSWRRIHREAAEKISMPVSVRAGADTDVARYLATKGLCPRTDVPPQENAKQKEFRYPNLEVYANAIGDLHVRDTRTPNNVTVAWQDKNLADPNVSSRVGALTWSARAGSKTGLSHVCDWAQFLDLIDSSGQLSPIGRLLTTLPGTLSIPFEQWNPYVLSAERIIVGFQYFRKDMDLFTRFAPRLLHSKRTLTKSTCRELFVEALAELLSDAESSRSMASSARFEVFQQVRDLEKAARKSDQAIGATSTAWHRTSSRVETLVDLGLLEKGRNGEDEKYQYKYYPTARLSHAVDTIAECQTTDEWLDKHYIAVVLGVPTARPNEPIPLATLLEELAHIVATLKLPTTLLPIDCLTLGLAYMHAESSHFESLGEIRKLLEELPMTMPNVARLSRGRVGIRAEYISLNLGNTKQ